MINRKFNLIKNVMWKLPHYTPNAFTYNSGYSIAHYEVAKECERLGGFYVGKKVYKCHKVEE
jgi:hypothetical protein